MNNVEFRKYGNGSSVYEVFVMVKYCDITRVKWFETLGFVEKINNQWIDKKRDLIAKTRKELVGKILELRNKELQ